MRKWKNAMVRIARKKCVFHREANSKLERVYRAMDDHNSIYHNLYIEIIETLKSFLIEKPVFKDLKREKMVLCSNLSVFV